MAEIKKWISLTGLKEAIDKLLVKVDQKITEIKLVEIVAELPTGEDIKENTIYLVPDENAEENNEYDEYVWLSSKSKWELLGKVTIDLDPANYYTSAQVDELIQAVKDSLSSYALKTDLPTNVSELTNDAKYVAEGNNVSVLVNDAKYVAEGDNVSVLTNDAGYLTDEDFEEATIEEIDALFD